MYGKTERLYNTDETNIDTEIVGQLKMPNFTFNELTVARDEFVKLCLGVLKIKCDLLKFCSFQISFLK
jgi:hypothetical protein